MSTSILVFQIKDQRNEILIEANNFTSQELNRNENLQPIGRFQQFPHFDVTVIFDFYHSKAFESEVLAFLVKIMISELYI